MWRKQPRNTDPSAMFLARNRDEALASIDGQIAIIDTTISPPGRARFKAFHKLRRAARLCPGAAYNLSNFLMEKSDGRPHRYRMAIDLLVTTAHMTEDRIADLEAAKSWPDKEYFIRDIASRALTNIGAKVANSGQPGEAVDYFRRSIRLFSGNSNSWLCLGNMGVFYSSESGLDPLEGMHCWKTAYSLGDPLSDIDGNEVQRRHVVEIAERGVADYGEEVVRDWIANRLVPTLHQGRKSMLEMKRLVESASDLEEVIGKPWNSRSTLAAEFIGNFLRTYHDLDPTLEDKVTFAGSLLLSIVNRHGGSATERHGIIKDALRLCHSFDPVFPMIGDDEWRDVGLPETEHLLYEGAKAAHCEMVATVIDGMEEEIPDIDALDAAAGLLFHLDSGFRKGVTSMVIPQLERMTGEIEYLPAVYVGSARPAGT